MSFGFWGYGNTPAVNLNMQPLGYALLLLYAALLTWTAYRERHIFTTLQPGQSAVWVGSVLGGLVLSNLFVADFGYAGGFPAADVGWRPVPLLIGIPIVLASAVGIFPAATVGLAAGTMQAFWLTHNLLQPFELALWGVLTAYLIRQDYRGWISHLVRLPMSAAPLAGFGLWAASCLSTLAYKEGSIASSVLLYAQPLAFNLFVILVGAGVAGIAVQITFAVYPALVPARQGTRLPPFIRSLRSQILFVSVPMIVIVIIVLSYSVHATAIRVAITQSLNQARRDTSNAALGIPFMVQISHGLLAQFAEDETLRSPSDILRQEQLERYAKKTGFFTELLLLDPALKVINAYPRGQATVLAEPERTVARRVAASKATLYTGVHRLSAGTRQDGSRDVLSFAAPVMEPDDELLGVLVGRVDLRSTPWIQSICEHLQHTLNDGYGFVVDERNRIVMHPDPDMILTTWTPNPDPGIVLSATAREDAYIETHRDGTRWLVYYAPVEGHPWTTVIYVPYEAVAELASHISKPFAVILLLVGLGAIVGIWLLSSRLTRPVETLSSAVTQIAQGKLDAPVEVAGENEIGQLGRAFETMRVSMRKRLQELALLLNISRVVSANLNLQGNLEPILTGTMQATLAASARILLLSPEGAPEREIVIERTKKAIWRKAAPFSGPLRRLRRAHRPITIRDTSLYPGAFSAASAMALCFPLLVKDRLIGVFVVEYEAVDDPPQSEVEFLSTLASQAAVAVESARLFETVESERRRLGAVLDSTSDAIIVTDNNDAVVLVNPAAQEAFQLKMPDAIGRPVSELPVPDDLVELLTEAADGAAAQTRQFSLPDSRTLYAIASPVNIGDGQTQGRVAVMRDITHLKEMDTMKSEFVSHVSHDLREPLQVVLGYLDLIRDKGELNEKQREYLEKMHTNVTQMKELVDTLLRIGKIEAGVDVEMKPGHLGQIIAQVAAELRPRAEAKNLRLSATVPRDIPPITMDQALIRQAVINLVDNAIKYTAEGFVRLTLYQSRHEIVISVQDSGLGIAAVDQPRIFEKFYRVKSRETIHIRGTGLGLSMVKSIAELHHGRVWVESKPGEGSNFYLILPRTLENRNLN